MNNYITGDTHGNYSDLLARLSSIPSENLFICGDFGFIWEDTVASGLVLDELNDRGKTIYFIDGNHENFDLLQQYPEQDMFGGKVGVIRNNIIHLKRGYVYTIEGKTIYTMGGGISID